MNRPEPAVGLEGKFSHQHCAAAALVDGAGHEAQFSDERVRDPRIAALRGLVRASVDQGVAEDEVHVTIRLTSGEAHSVHIAHATGSPQNPMTDAQLEAKFRALAGEVFSTERTEALLEAAWHLEDAPDLGAFVALAGAPH
jgi:2-methylcitrate dehydratase PrpD